MYFLTKITLNLRLTVINCLIYVQYITGMFLQHLLLYQPLNSELDFGIKVMIQVLKREIYLLTFVSYFHFG